MIQLILLLSVSRKYLINFLLLYCFIVPISSTSLVLNILQPHYEVGSNVTLTCFVTKPNPHHVDINTTVNIQWSFHKRNSNQYSIYSYNKNYNHTLIKLKLSNAGEYKCSYYLISANDDPYIKQSEVKTEVTNVTIKSKLHFRVIRHHSFVVPKGNIPFIVSSFKTYENGSFINLTCYATYLNTSLIDVATNVNIQWLNSSNHTLHSYTGLNDYTEHTLNYTISNVNLTNAGQYTCAFFIDSANHPYILASDTTISSVNISISKYFLVYRDSFFYTH